ncbi:MAG: hypothetical protein JWR85_3498 [Marmoricola sp.]|jgi:hypothetical protein|nr:hypothetical protein [Marmoricola sp.]
MTYSPVHRCECPLCQSREPHPDEAFHHYMNVFLSRLNEPQRRWFVALEAMRLGHGGKHLLAQITGMSPTTILRGRHELEADLVGCPELHMRAPGGGRPAAEERDPELEDTLETVLALETAGDPMGRRPKAKRSSLRHLSAALEKKGHAVSRPTVSKLLRKLKYSPKVNARRTEVRGASPAQRHEQFDHINELREDFGTTGDPIISVDTKKKS